MASLVCVDNEKVIGKAMKKRQNLPWRYDFGTRFGSEAAICALLSSFGYHNKNSIASPVAMDV